MARLSDEEIEERLSDAKGWERDGEAIHRQFELGDFKGSVDFVNRLTPRAEEMNHHPDLEISWDKVTVHAEHPLRGRADRGRLRACSQDRRSGVSGCYPRSVRR
jgi:4a-hydroxytetrahydrobiopterin dehydratase